MPIDQRRGPSLKDICWQGPHMLWYACQWNDMPHTRIVAVSWHSLSDTPFQKDCVCHTSQFTNMPQNASIPNAKCCSAQQPGTLHCLALKSVLEASHLSNAENADDALDCCCAKRLWEFLIAPGPRFCNLSRRVEFASDSRLVLARIWDQTKARTQNWVWCYSSLMSYSHEVYTIQNGGNLTWSAGFIKFLLSWPLPKLDPESRPLQDRI